MRAAETPLETLELRSALVPPGRSRWVTVVCASRATLRSIEVWKLSAPFFEILRVTVDGIEIGKPRGLAAPESVADRRFARRHNQVVPSSDVDIEPGTEIAVAVRNVGADRHRFIGALRMELDDSMPFEESVQLSEPEPKLEVR